MKKFGFYAIVAVACLATATTSFAVTSSSTSGSTASASILNPVFLTTDGDLLEFGGWFIPFDSLGVNGVEACTIEVEPVDDDSLASGGVVTETDTGSSCTSTSPTAHDDQWFINGPPSTLITINNGTSTADNITGVPTVISRISGPTPCAGDTDIPIDAWQQASSGAAAAAYSGSELTDANGQAQYAAGATIHPTTRQCPGTYQTAYSNTVFY